jgi:hypothetical protein
MKHELIANAKLVTVIQKQKEIRAETHKGTLHSLAVNPNFQIQIRKPTPAAAP